LTVLIFRVISTKTMPPKAAASRPAAAKKKAPIHKLPDPIRDGEIVRDIQKRQWRLGKSIGVGGFGEIYAGIFSLF
jgi:vaccinia related kinase